MGIAQNNATIFQPILDDVSWTNETIEALQQSTLNGPQVFFSRNDVGIDVSSREMSNLTAFILPCSTCTRKRFVEASIIAGIDPGTQCH